MSIIDQTGTVRLHYAKVFICNFGLEELSQPSPDDRHVGADYNMRAGTALEVTTLRGAWGEVVVGAMICSDREFPEAATQLMLKGAELVLVPNACTWHPILTDVLKARAFENQFAVAMANYAAPQCNGNSRAYYCAAWNASGPHDVTIVEAGIITAAIDLDQVRQFRAMEQWRLDHRRRWYAR